MVWIVERIKFNENTLMWEYDGVMQFKNDRELINYLMTQSSNGAKLMHRITRIKEVV